MEVGAVGVVATGKVDAGAAFGEVWGVGAGEGVEEVGDVVKADEVLKEGAEAGDLRRGDVLVVLEAMVRMACAELIEVGHRRLCEVGNGHTVSVEGDGIEEAVGRVASQRADVAEGYVDGATVEEVVAQDIGPAVGGIDAMDAAVAVYNIRRCIVIAFFVSP